MRLLTLSPHGPASEIRDAVRRLEDLGVDGVMAGDHLFHAPGGDRRNATPGYDPFTLLAAIGTLSDSLSLGTIVVNTAWIHPFHVIRHFAQMALMFGGDRVLAGLGAGWNPPEFHALGMRMPPFQERMDHLERACAMTRQLFDTGIATVDPIAKDLPFAPRPETAPRLFLGGGSDRLLDLAGRYADDLDINGATSHGRLRGPQPSKIDGARRILTTIADLQDAVARVSRAASDAGRPMPRCSVLVTILEFCAESELADAEARICAAHGIDRIDLGQCPFALVGEPERIRDLLAERRERLGLDAMIMTWADLERVAPLVKQS